MNSLRRQLFTCAGFTLNQHRRTRTGVEHNSVPHLFHLRRVTAHISQRIAGAQHIARGVLPVSAQRQTGHIQRVDKSLTHGGRRIDKNAGHARFFRQIGNQPRADHRLGAVGLQLIDLSTSIFFGDIAALFKLQIKGFLKGEKRRNGFLIGNDANRRGQFSRFRQRLEYVKPAGFNQDHWNR